MFKASQPNAFPHSSGGKLKAVTVTSLITTLPTDILLETKETAPDFSKKTCFYKNFFFLVSSVPEV